MRTLLMSSLAAACLLGAGLTGTASARTTWLCKPGRASNPCTVSLNATIVDAAGRTLRTERTKIDPRAPIDCFFVYPTVSDQQTTNATLKIDPQERAIALYEASRFSSQCRVFAPMYRQVTLATLLERRRITPQARALAYGDIRSAWRQFLARESHGRGFVLIGHSQGTFALRQLIKDEIDRKPAVRRRLVSALLLGGNVTVARGKTWGGDFRNVRACRSASQLGCVVAYSTFGEPPPATSMFGRVTGAGAAKLQVLCTNPAALGGGSGRLRSYIPIAPFPGTLGVGIGIQIGPLPQVSTNWIGQDGSYTARCESSGDATYLRVITAPGARVLPAIPNADWGLHLADVNIALGNLTSLVHRQAVAYARRALR